MINVAVMCNKKLTYCVEGNSLFYSVNALWLHFCLVSWNFNGPVYKNSVLQIWSARQNFCPLSFHSTEIFLLNCINFMQTVRCAIQLHRASSLASDVRFRFYFFWFIELRTLDTTHINWLVIWVISFLKVINIALQYV